MEWKNLTVHAGGNTFDAIQFGRGEKELVAIPGVGDGLATVKGEALRKAIQYRAFGRHYHVTMISRRNELTEEDTTETMARQQAEAMEALGIRRAHVVGVSQGGMIAQHLAADFPQLVDHLVLVVTIPESNDLITANARRWIGYARAGDYKQLMIDSTEKCRPERYLRRMRWSYPFMGLMAGHPDARRYVIQAVSCMTHDATAKLGKITAPTLVIGGEEDETLGCEGSRLLHGAIPGSRLILYPGQGHSLYEDEKDFSRAVLEFLD